MQCHIYLELITLLLYQIGLQLGNIPVWQMSPVRQITCSKRGAILISYFYSMPL